jgi:hypothetical protein
VSETISVGVVGPSHWSYMAAVMAQRLEAVVERRRLEARDIPLGVYLDAKKFFDLVLQEVGGGPRENPPASINAYVIAAHAVREAQSMPAAQDVKPSLEEYSRLLLGLQQPRDLTVDELNTAGALRKFFLQLRKAGQVEAYERRIRFEEPSPRMRYLTKGPHHNPA